MRLRTMIVALFVSLALFGAACGGDDDDGDDVASQGADDGTTTTTPSSNAADPYATQSTEGSSSTSGATVRVADDPKLGKILVGPNGHTLYLFTKDTGTTTACTGGCATAWPALTSSAAPTGGTGVDAAKLSTASGGQVVYNGHLLYYFASDSAAGQTNGTAIANWFAVNPAGNQIGG